MSTTPPLSAARAGVPARQAGEQAQPMGIPTLVPLAPPARPAPPLPRPEEPLNVTNELQSICGHGGKSNYMVRLAGRPRPAQGAGELLAPRRRSALSPRSAPTQPRHARLRLPAPRRGSSPGAGAGAGKGGSPAPASCPAPAEPGARRRGGRTAPARGKPGSRRPGRVVVGAGVGGVRQRART